MDHFLIPMRATRKHRDSERMWVRVFFRLNHVTATADLHDEAHDTYFNTLAGIRYTTCTSEFIRGDSLRKSQLDCHEVRMELYDFPMI